MDLEKDLKGFDFSKLSKVRESLLEDLLAMRRNKRNSRRFFAGNILSDEELDCAAAAGTNYIPKPPDKFNK